MESQKLRRHYLFEKLIYLTYLLELLMSINSDNLKAFITIFELGSFTKAAEALGMTQSALSQKMARLESYLETTLLIRKASGLELTSSGLKLIPYTKQLLQTEGEFLSSFHSSRDDVRGVLRVGGYSSIVRSMIIPTLAPLIRKYPLASVEFSSFEMGELALSLSSGKLDLIITDYFLKLPGCEETLIGKEEFVLIESQKHSDIPDIYLDHSPRDNASMEFVKFQGMGQEINRGFMGDVYGIMDGVALGLGRAVMSRHLVQKDTRFKIMKTKKKYYRPVVASFYRQAYHTKLHREVLSLLVGQERL